MGCGVVGGESVGVGVVGDEMLDVSVLMLNSLFSIYCSYVYVHNKKNI